MTASTTRKPEPTVAEHPGHEHGLGTIAGYSIVRTSWSKGARNIRRGEVARVDGANRYAEALEIVSGIRDEIAGTRQPDEDGRYSFAVIDNIYACGCRSHEVEPDTDATVALDTETLHANLASARSRRDAGAPGATDEVAKLEREAARRRTLRETRDDEQAGYTIKCGLTGDTAEADDAEAALVAARQLVDDAFDGMPIQGRTRAARNSILIHHAGRYDGPLTEIAKTGASTLDALGEGRR